MELRFCSTKQYACVVLVASLLALANFSCVLPNSLAHQADELGTRRRRSDEVISIENTDQLIELEQWGNGLLQGITYSRDGKSLMVNSSFGTYQYGVQGMKVVNDFKYVEHYEYFYSPDKSWVAIRLGEDSNVVAISRTDDSIEPIFITHREPIITIAFSPDNEIFVSCSRDGEVKVWQLNDPKLNSIRYFPNVWDMSYSPGGQILAISSGKDILLLLANNFSEYYRLEGHHGKVSAIDFSPDGRFLAMESAENVIAIWGLDRNEIVHEIRASAGYTTISFSDDSKTIGIITDEFLSQPEQLEITVLGVENGKVIHHVEIDKKQGFSKAALSPDHKQLALASNGGRVKFWSMVDDSSETVYLKGFVGIVTSMDISPDGQKIALGSMDGCLQMLGTQTGIIFYDRQTLGYSAIKQVRFSPDGDLLATASKDGNLEVWRVDGGMLLWSTDLFSEASTLAFSEKGDVVAVGTLEKEIRLFQAANGSLLATIQGTAIDFLPEGNAFILGQENGDIAKWGMSTMTPEFLLFRGGGIISAMMLSPNGEFLSVVSMNEQNPGGVRLLRTKDGYSITSLWAVWGTTAVAYSPDSQLIATASQNDNDAIQLWMSSNGYWLSRLLGHDEEITSIAFTPDGRRIISASMDGSIRVWGIP